ncbi:MAG TPA: hypothetical protein VLP43_06650 [Solirubrobacteraceae bacterium]|nr:hypothetical protein [Solirubrobacteraceae bacterium]
MLLATIRDDLTELCRALDVVETTRDYATRQQQLKRALVASERAVAGVRDDEGLPDALNEASAATSMYTEEVERTVDDAMLFGSFLAAERRLFADLGFDVALMTRLLGFMQPGRLVDGNSRRVDDLEDRLAAFSQQLADAIGVVEAEQDHERSIGLVRWALLVAGGVFMVRINLMIGAGGLAVTGGLSAAGAAVASSFGVSMIDASLPLIRS